MDAGPESWLEKMKTWFLVFDLDFVLLQVEILNFLPS